MLIRFNLSFRVIITYILFIRLIAKSVPSILNDKKSYMKMTRIDSVGIIIPCFSRIWVGSWIAGRFLYLPLHRGFCRQAGNMESAPCRGSPAWCVDLLRAALTAWRR